MAGRITIEPSEIEEAASWLRNQKELLQQGLQEADTKMADVVAAAYSTPGSETKFKPYWDEYNTGTKNAIEGLEGVSNFLQAVSNAFVSTDDQTAGSIG
ncbi:WXG100 family type VII secretion target [Streptomyces microflavus]|uniref:WXG100 family type VII secretion target n=1 Tax=Streptomyces microflavus TaxID=1919 RepID=A0A7J0CIZ8_STRMI|nr:MULTISPECIES: WXG100 family type VII secretion target [Streptomyces]MDX2977665.1 WXG100 family type VII secretion target [Streptomyces sp. NRRL_B-2249]WSA59300.1 WXG100 family type VII secretion target [Streptomyces microflavus]WSS38192.1 WXG100 family type VII secretion target [Streptomyces microflavus]WST13089.1 WXG100 family type VII secretion target [Streptomyces microflavus]SCK28285.1 Proteins of 100 residues with WXG [Streptomyces sp. ScaeMP-e48]